jgi:SAM-dependent methyltransferase
VRRAGVAAYGPLAAAYDIVHAGKPYAREARIVRALARRYARRPLRTLLDVACGSGRHLEQFVRWFDCTGLDRSRSMLARARRRVPGARYFLGHMESFDLGRTYDVVTCLFSAIGYVRSPAELRRTLRRFARHTAPGGVVVIEPWLTPAIFRGGRVHHLAAEENGTTVVRMNGSLLRRGRSIFDFHYLVGRAGTVRHAVERHDLGLFDRRTVRSAIRAAGLVPHYIPGGLATGRGLWVGVAAVEKPAAASRGATVRRSRPPASR